MEQNLEISPNPLYPIVYERYEDIDINVMILKFTGITGEGLISINRSANSILDGLEKPEIIICVPTLTPGELKLISPLVLFDPAFESKFISYLKHENLKGMVFPSHVNAVVSTLIQPIPPMLKRGSNRKLFFFNFNQMSPLLGLYNALDEALRRDDMYTSEDTLNILRLIHLPDYFGNSKDFQLPLSSKGD